MLSQKFLDSLREYDEDIIDFNQWVMIVFFIVLFLFFFMCPCRLMSDRE